MRESKSFVEVMNLPPPPPEPDPYFASGYRDIAAEIRGRDSLKTWLDAIDPDKTPAEAAPPAPKKPHHCGDPQWDALMDIFKDQEAEAAAAREARRRKPAPRVNFDG